MSSADVRECGVMLSPLVLYNIEQTKKKNHFKKCQHASVTLSRHISEMEKQHAHILFHCFVVGLNHIISFFFVPSNMCLIFSVFIF
jgi:hypothetical protein